MPFWSRITGSKHDRRDSRTVIAPLVVAILSTTVCCDSEKLVVSFGHLPSRPSDSTQYTRNFHANHGVGFEAYGYARLPFSSSVSESVKLPDTLLNGRSSDCVANADHGSN